MNRGSSLADLFEARYVPEPNSGCWLWTGTVNEKNRYGYLGHGPKDLLAHRVAYGLFVGAIPEELELDHLCRVRSCVNPAHLEPVTRRVNLLRSPITQTSINASATHCPQGHPYDAKNTWRERDGHRRCRQCCNANVRRWKQRQRQSV